MNIMNAKITAKSKYLMILHQVEPVIWAFDFPFVFTYCHDEFVARYDKVNENFKISDSCILWKYELMEVVARDE